MRLICAALLVFVIFHANSQRIDPTFNPVIAQAGTIKCVVAQPDDKLIIASSNLISLGIQRIGNIVRLHPDGTVDNTFQSGTGFEDMGVVSGSLITDVILRPDGKILVSGDFTSYNGKPIREIALLNADGTLDESFNVGQGPNQAAEALAAQTDGKVIAAGGFTAFNGITRHYIVRLNSDGTVDDTFNPLISSGDFNIVNAVAVQSDGKILVGGNFTTINGEAKQNLVRLNADGSTDASFVGVATVRVHSFALLPDGKIVVGGEGLLTRLNVDGSVNQSFSAINGTQRVYGLAVQSDNKIIAVGSFTVSANNIARFNVNGTQDNTFATGLGLNHVGFSVCALTTGKIVVSGQFDKYQNTLRGGLVCINSNGSIDSGFDPMPGTLATLVAMEHQSDGKLLIGGAFRFVNGQIVNNMARLNTDGTLDNSFSTTGSGFGSTVMTIKQIKNGPHAGKFMVGGYFGNYNNVPSTGVLIRLHNNGQLDNTFSSAAFTGSGYLTALQLADDDEVIAGGSFTLTGGKKNFAKVNASGVVDETFNSDNAITSVVKEIRPWTDNSYLVVAGQPVRVGDNGNLFPGYTAPAVQTYHSAGLRPDGRMLVSGSFNTIGGVNTRGLAILEETGAIDPSFLYGRILGENYIKSIAPLGEKYSALALEISYSTRGNSSFGVIDTDGRQIQTNAPIFGDIRTIQAYQDQLYACGYFYDTTFHRHTSLVRMLTDPAPFSAPLALTATTIGNTIELSWSDFNVHKNGFEILRSTNGTENYEVTNIVNPEIRTFSDATVEGNQTYYYKVRAFTTNGPSPASNEANAVAFPKAPFAPTGFVVTELSPSRARATWSDKSLNENGFRIYSSSTLLKETTANTVEIDIDLLTPGKNYLFKIVAYNDEGESDGSYVSRTLSNPSGGAWSITTSNASLVRSSAVAFAIGSKGYVATGQNQSGRLKDLWEFDPTNNTWNQLADFPGTPRVGAVGFEIDGVGYVGLGNDGSGAFKNDFYKYVPSENEWTPVADFPLDPVGGAGRSSATALVIGSYAYVCFGNNGTNFPKEFYRYDAVNNSWEKMADFPGTGRSGAVAFTLNGFGYFGLGGVSTKRNDWWRYTPAENKWNSDPFYPTSAAAGAVAFVQGGRRAYVGLGDISSSALSELPIAQFNERDILNDVTPWREVNNFSGQARTSAITFTINDVTYVGLGVKNGVYLDDLHQFTSTVHFLPAEPSQLSATTISNHSIKITWTDLANNEDGYLIECASNSGYQRIGTLPPNTNEFVHSDLNKNQSFSYRVIAFNEYGKSAHSPYASAYTLLPPAAPTALATQLTNGINIALSWEHSGEDVTKFILEVSENGTDFSILSNSIAATARTYAWSNRPVEKQYFFRISAANQMGSSPLATTSVTTTQPKPVAPTLQSTPVHVGSRLIKISWFDMSTNESGFNIYRSTGSENAVLINSTAQGVTNYTDATVEPAQQYTYTISSFNGTGESFAANGLQVQTDPERTATITSAEQTDPEDGAKVMLTWTGNAKSTQQYKIERAVAEGIFELLTTIPSANTMYQDNAVTFEETYHYRIGIHDEMESFDYSNVVSVTMSPAPVVTSVDEQLKANVYPNPVVSNLVIESQVRMDQAELLHVSGKHIKTVDLNGATSTEMHLSDLVAGVYFIKITCEEKVLLLRVVKQ